MNDFNDIIEDVRSWHLRVFGKPCDPKRTIMKLFEEVAELHAAIRSQDNVRKTNEIVDVLLVSLSIAAALIPDDEGDLIDGLYVKMKIVEERDQISRDKERR